MRISTAPTLRLLQRSRLTMTCTGTNKGSFLGHPATGKQIHTNEMSIYRIVDGKIMEQWLIPDLLSLNQQLGLISQVK